MLRSKSLDPDYLLPPIEELLASGGDSRIRLNNAGVNKYGCPPFPEPDALMYGSSTASTISPAGFEAALRCRRRLENAARREPPSVTYAREMDRVRREIINLCGLSGGAHESPEIVFGDSGTTLHLLTAQLLSEAHTPLTIIMPEEPETGSGVKAALEGRSFSACTPHGGPAIFGGKIVEDSANNSAVEILPMTLRLPDGGLRPISRIDSETEAFVEQAVDKGNRVLAILTDVSKTGEVFPSPACCVMLRRRFPENVDILVDACQFRISNATLRSYLESGFMVAMTGSKFVAGPAYCAALLVPRSIAMRVSPRSLPPAFGAYSARADWPESWPGCSSLSNGANYGLLLRFEAALVEWRAFHSLSEEKIFDFLHEFGIAAQKRLSDSDAFEPLARSCLSRRPTACGDGWDSLPTIFPFILRNPKSGEYLGAESADRIYELMKRDLSQHPEIPISMRQAAHWRCYLGQPVECGSRNGIPVSAPRLNIDMRLIADALSPNGRGREAAIAGALCALDKAEILAKIL
jgi:hypothetical protein